MIDSNVIPTIEQMEMMDDMAEFARSDYFRIWLLEHPLRHELKETNDRP